MRFNFKFDRDGNYYFGLVLLVIASASIIWAFFFDGFDPEDFLVYFLVYAWGFTLLLKSDTEYRFNRLEKVVTTLQAKLDQIVADALHENKDGQEETIEVEDAVGIEQTETFENDNAEQMDPLETEAERAANAESEISDEKSDEA
ncbi:MAG TPA: hypothetical protein GXZ98_03035 [Firmicutes bacterium]|jgi:hypothetical protein|nr:hypothetical protein [Bacillota bacterium]